jgi:hypothetical protein
MFVPLTRYNRDRAKREEPRDARGYLIESRYFAGNMIVIKTL